MIKTIDELTVRSRRFFATVVALAAIPVPEAAAKKDGKGAGSGTSGRVTGLAADPSDPAAAKCKSEACTGKLRASPAQKKAKDNKHLDVDSWSWGSK